MSSPQPDLLQEFRDLCLLLILTAAVNSSSYCPMLRLSESSSATNYLDRQSTVMHSITSILVREHDVCACMTNGPNVEAQRGGDAIYTQGSSDRLEDPDHGAKYLVDIPGNLHLTTIANPEQNDDSSDLEYGCCIKAKDGKNQWPSIKDLTLNRWHYLDKTW